MQNIPIEQFLWLYHYLQDMVLRAYSLFFSAADKKTLAADLYDSTRTLLDFSDSASFRTDDKTFKLFSDWYEFFVLNTRCSVLVFITLTPAEENEESSRY